MNEIVDGHETALCVATLWIAFLFIAWFAMRQIDDIRCGKYKGKEKPRALRPFNERDHEYDPHADENNLGRH